MQILSRISEPFGSSIIPYPARMFLCHSTPLTPMNGFCQNFANMILQILTCRSSESKILSPNSFPFGSQSGYCPICYVRESGKKILASNPHFMQPLSPRYRTTILLLICSSCSVCFTKTSARTHRKIINSFSCTITSFSKL